MIGKMQQTIFNKNNYTLIETVPGTYLSDGKYKLTKSGKEFINSVNGRLMSLKNISTGSDLFERSETLKKPKRRKKS